MNLEGLSNQDVDLLYDVASDALLLCDSNDYNRDNARTVLEAARSEREERIADNGDNSQ